MGDSMNVCFGDTDRENTEGITLTPTKSLLSSYNHNSHPPISFPTQQSKRQKRSNRLLQIYPVLGCLFLTACLCIGQSQLHVFLSTELWLLQHKCCKPMFPIQPHEIRELLLFRQTGGLCITTMSAAEDTPSSDTCKTRTFFLSRSLSL